MGLFDFIKKTDPDLTLPKTAQEIWFRDTYALWSQSNFDEFEHFCGLEKNSDNASQCRFLLGRDWNTIGKVPVLQMFESLTGANDDTYDMMEDLRNSTDPKDASTYIMLRNAVAWDLCRSTQILGMAYHGGWIDRETMNEKSTIAGKLMQSNFESWEDLIHCYLEGYRDWAFETFKPHIAEGNVETRKECYEIIKNHRNAAYKIDWNLQL